MDDIKEFAERHLHCGFDEFSKAMNNGEWKRIHKYCWERIVHVNDDINFLALFAGDIPLIGWASGEINDHDNMFVWDVEIKAKGELCYPMRFERNWMIENRYGSTVDTHIVCVEMEYDLQSAINKIRKGTLSARIEDSLYPPFEPTVPQYIIDKNKADTIEYFRKESERAAMRYESMLD